MRNEQAQARNEAKAHFKSVAVNNAIRRRSSRWMYWEDGKNEYFVTAVYDGQRVDVEYSKG